MGLVIEEYDLERDDEPDVIGLVVVWWLDPAHERYRVVLFVAPGTTTERRAQFAEWAASRLSRLMESGPEPDGWQERQTDGGLQLWARLVFLPEVTTEDLDYGD